MTEPQATEKKDWHSASRLVHYHVQISAAQKTEIEKHCDRYEKSQGQFTREAINYLLGFYHNLEQEKGGGQ